MGKKKRSGKSFVYNILSAIWRKLVVSLYRIWLNISNPIRRKKLWKKSSSFVSLVINCSIKKRIPREAGSLAYVTILGFIPFITFIVMIAPDLPFLNLKDKIADVVAKNFIPGSAEAVMDMINEMIARRMGLNIMVFAILLISSYLLFNNIRATFDSILSTHARENPDILAQFVKFFGTLVFGFIILVLLFSSSSLPIISRLVKLKIFTWLMFILPFVTQFMALYFLYKLLPTARIKQRSLIVGTFWTTVIWSLIKTFFDYYIYNITSYQAVYGVLAALPIFLFWIYVNWLIILGGIVLVSVIDKDVREEVIQKKPEQVVKVTLEMYSDSKLNNRLETYINKKDIKDLVDQFDEDGIHE
ncbi:MAG: YihY family inner membrane protein [Candidatus Cloacimonetes bacterium]|jgi:membrane protein|nr:YihY family inner membrane protein [Candidatus Cloacimonadota bacterium]MDD2506124.1 YihY family inner membrane protein [Candidatus Cloacimonadota bacterium]MDD4147884.1 YihY family inner membrane protein [Candidatus Cloacimonadota bacterium]MDD4559727.1 YihY family inner membrane protein [Candidatus Cloacimonadota bacterium]